jgi:Fe-S cluster assembly protein SufD
VTIETPFQTRVFADADAPAIFAHTLIVVEEGAHAVFIDEFISPTAASGQGFSNGAVELHTRANAHLRYFSVQDWGRHVWHFNTQRLIADRDSTTNSLSILIGSKLTKTNVESSLRGEGATSEMLGIYFGDGTQHFDQHTIRTMSSRTRRATPLQGGVARPGAAGLLGDDQGRAGGAEDERLPGEPQPPALRQGAGGLDAEAGDRRERRPLHPRRDDGPGRAGIPLLSAKSRPDQEEAERVIVEGFLDEIVQRIPSKRSATASPTRSRRRWAYRPEIRKTTSSSGSQVYRSLT